MVRRETLHRGLGEITLQQSYCVGHADARTIARGGARRRPDGGVGRGPAAVAARDARGRRRRAPHRLAGRAAAPRRGPARRRRARRGRGAPPRAEHRQHPRRRPRGGSTSSSGASTPATAGPPGSSHARATRRVRRWRAIAAAPSPARSPRSTTTTSRRPRVAPRPASACRGAGARGVSADEPPAVRCEGLRLRVRRPPRRRRDRPERPPRARCSACSGPNGAGKTTTIRLLNTLLPLAGRHRRRCSATTCAASAMAVRRLLGYVPQQLSDRGALTGRENVDAVRAAVRRAARERKAARRRRAGGDGPRRRRRSARRRPTPAAWSAGSSSPRRSSTGRALLVLDEPTIGLDPIARDGVWERIAELRAHDGHDRAAHDALHGRGRRLCDRVALMHRGTLRAVGSPPS